MTEIEMVVEELEKAERERVLLIKMAHEQENAADEDIADHLHRMILFNAASIRVLEERIGEIQLEKAKKEKKEK